MPEYFEPQCELPVGLQEDLAGPHVAEPEAILELRKDSLARQNLRPSIGKIYATTMESWEKLSKIGSLRLQLVLPEFRRQPHLHQVSTATGLVQTPQHRQ